MCRTYPVASISGPHTNVDKKAERYICLRLEHEHFDVLRMDITPHIKQSYNNDKQERAPPTPPGIERERKNGTEWLQSREPESIVNMSSKSLTKAHSSLLLKGLKFVPARRNINKGKLTADLRTWERRMRLREYFHDTERSDDGLEDDDMQYKKESSWTTGAGRDKWLDAYITAVKDDLISGLRKKIKLKR